MIRINVCLHSGSKFYHTNKQWLCGILNTFFYNLFIASKALHNMNVVCMESNNYEQSCIYHAIKYCRRHSCQKVHNILYGHCFNYNLFVEFIVCYLRLFSQFSAAQMVMVFHTYKLFHNHHILWDMLKVLSM